jgi:hypothetical protein
VLTTRKYVVVAAAAVAVAVTAAVLIVSRDDDGGLDTSSGLATEVLHSLSARDQGALLKLSDPKKPGREAAARQLIDSCRTSDFGSASVDVRGGFGPETAWADIVVPQGQPGCQKLTLLLSNDGDGWHVALGGPVVPTAIPTAASNG